MAGPTLGILLAGGRSQRMGRDKAWLETPQGPLLTTLADRLLTIGPVVVCARRGQVLPPSQDGCRRIDDEMDDQGLLAAVVAAWDVGGDPTDAFVLACDHPGFDPSFARILLDADPQAPAVLPELRGDAVPTHAVIRRAAIDGLRLAAARGERSLRRAIRGAGGVVMTEAAWRAAGMSEASLLDADTPKDWVGWT